MKHLLPLLFIIIFNFSASAQIEKSDWEGKTVLMVVKDDSTSLSTDTKYYNSWNNELSKNWYLTNSIKSIPRSLLNPNLDKVGQDTVLILWESNWEKILLSTRNCDSGNPYDCLNWTLGESYQFRNFQNGNWEMYIFPLYNKEHDNLKKLQQLITNSSYDPTYEGKTIIVKNRVWSEEIEELINNRFQNTELKTVMSFGNEYSDDNYIDYDNAIYIYERNFRNSDYIEIIDLKTNRVIEKIELEPK